MLPPEMLPCVIGANNLEVMPRKIITEIAEDTP